MVRRQSSSRDDICVSHRAPRSAFRALALLFAALAFLTVDLAVPDAAAAIPAARGKKKKRPAKKPVQAKPAGAAASTSPSALATHSSTPAPSQSPPPAQPPAPAQPAPAQPPPALRFANGAAPPDADLASAHTFSPAASTGEPIGYLSAFLATTLVYRPYRGSFEPPPGDISPTLGVGYNVSKKIALELDGGPTFVSGRYVSTSLIAGVVWTLHPIVYAAGRFVVPVQPELNFALFPGVGGTYAFGSIAPFVEVNVLSTIGRGAPDFGVVASAGASYLF